MVWNMFYFSILYIYIYWECHHPNWRSHIFQRGRYTTNQYIHTYAYWCDTLIPNNKPSRESSITKVKPNFMNPPVGDVKHYIPWPILQEWYPSMFINVYFMLFRYISQYWFTNPNICLYHQFSKIYLYLILFHYLPTGGIILIHID